MAEAAADTLKDRAKYVLQLAADQGFTSAGVAPAKPSELADSLRHWLAEGHHGQMHYLAEAARLEQMLDVQKFVPGAHSVICVADRYPADTDEQASPDGTRVGRIARYAWGDDYHDTIKDRLHHMADALRERFPDHVFRAAADTAPVMEREHAQRAGLGFIGKHTLLIEPFQTGSWLLLGVIVTTLPMQTSAEAAGVADDPLRFFGEGFQGCGTCTRCIDACPTQCITPYSVQAERCISYLTIEHRGPIEPTLHPQMGTWVAGCDVCQEVCPFNRPERRAEALPTQPPYRPRPPAPGIPLGELLNWTAADRQKAFKGSALKRIKLDDLRRNALIAAGNSLRQHPDPDLHQNLEQIALDPGQPPVVNLTAQQVLAALPAAAKAPPQ